MDKLNTHEIRKHQNLLFRGWIIKLCIFGLAGCVLLTLVSTMGELGLSGKSSINLGFANIEVNSGDSKKLSSDQQRQLEQKATEPEAQQFNTNNQVGYCQNEYGYYSFPMYTSIPYGPSYQGYYIWTAGGAQFGISDSYGNTTGVTANSKGMWQQTVPGSDIQICFDDNGTYSRFVY